MADRSKEWPQRDIGLRDVASLAGVSHITVSRTLRSPSRVSGQTRERVEAAIETLGYVPNMIAGTLNTRRSRMIAVIVPNVSNSVFAETLHALNARVRAESYQLIIGYSGYSLSEEEALVAAFLMRRPEAFVLTGYTHTPRTRTMLQAAGIPIVEMWNIGPDPIGTMVGFSNFAAARAMTRHIGGKGYSRIGFIGGLTIDNDRTSNREDGFRAGLADMGHNYDERAMVRVPFEFASGAQALHELIGRAPGIDAVFVAGDILAIGVLLECLKLGWAVPQRIGIAGFDDTPLAAIMIPALTTTRVPQTEIGHRVAEEVLTRITGEPITVATIDLGFQIIERDSL